MEGIIGKQASNIKHIEAKMSCHDQDHTDR